MKSLENNKATKYLNQFRVFRELFNCSPLTKKELSKNTNLSTPTVSKALSGLNSSKLIKEKGRKDIPTGRKPKKYGLNNTSIYTLGIDLEIPDLRIAIFDLSLRMLASKGTYIGMENLKKNPVDHLTKVLKGEIANLVRHEGLELNSIIGAGVAATGVVKEGSFRPFSRYKSSNDIQLKEQLEEKLGIPASFANDVDVQLLSELDKLGPIEDPNHVALYFGARVSGKRQPTIRIGGGIAIGGKVFRGAGGSAGEFGHMSIHTSNVKKKLTPKCGNINCLESFINNKLNENGKTTVPSTITDAVKQQIKDLIFAFSPSLIIVDLDAFPEITGEVTAELKSFTDNLSETMGLENIKIREPINKSRSVTRGAVINHFDKFLSDPDNFSLLMEKEKVTNEQKGG